MSDWQAGLIVLAIVPLLWGLMYAGWRARGRRQGHLVAPLTSPPTAQPTAPSTAQPTAQPTAPPTVPPTPPSGLAADPIPGLYISTVRSGDWLDRVVAHGLGVRSEATATIGDGVWWQRSGAPDVFVPAADVVAARADRGQAGKFGVEAASVVVVTWRLGDELLDTAFRPRRRDDVDELVAAIDAHVVAPSTQVSE